MVPASEIYLFFAVVVFFLTFIALKIAGIESLLKRWETELRCARALKNADKDNL